MRESFKLIKMMMMMKLPFIHLFSSLPTFHLNRREQKICSFVQHFVGTLEPITSADNKARIVVLVVVRGKLQEVQIVISRSTLN